MSEYHLRLMWPYQGKLLELGTVRMAGCPRIGETLHLHQFGNIRGIPYSWLIKDIGHHTGFGFVTYSADVYVTIRDKKKHKSKEVEPLLLEWDQKRNET